MLSEMDHLTWEHEIAECVQHIINYNAIFAEYLNHFF